MRPTRHSEKPRLDQIPLEQRSVATTITTTFRLLTCPTEQKCSATIQGMRRGPAYRVAGSNRPLRLVEVQPAGSDDEPLWSCAHKVKRITRDER